MDLVSGIQNAQRSSFKTEGGTVWELGNCTAGFTVEKALALPYLLKAIFIRVLLNETLVV